MEKTDTLRALHRIGESPMWGFFKWLLVVIGAFVGQPMLNWVMDIPHRSDLAVAVKEHDSSASAHPALSKRIDACVYTRCQVSVLMQRQTQLDQCLSYVADFKSCYLEAVAKVPFLCKEKESD